LYHIETNDKNERLVVLWRPKMPCKPAGPGGQNLSPSVERCVGHSLKVLDIVKELWPLSENSSPALVSQAGYGPANHGQFCKVIKT